MFSYLVIPAQAGMDHSVLQRGTSYSHGNQIFLGGKNGHKRRAANLVKRILQHYTSNKTSMESSCVRRFISAVMCGEMSERFNSTTGSKFGIDAAYFDVVFRILGGDFDGDGQHAAGLQTDALRRRGGSVGRRLRLVDARLQPVGVCPARQLDVRD